MKELVSKAKSFITFDLPVCFAHISEEFTKIHSQYQKQLPNWSFTATRRKVIANFWLRQVVRHYTAILLIAIFLTLSFTASSKFFITAIFGAGMPILLVLVVFIYWPTYYSDFLPKLETIIAEQEKLIFTQEEIKKCKRTQLSIPSLTIIYYVLSIIGNIPVLPSNDKSADLLNSLFGADKDKLKQNLSRLYKFSRLSVKERAEIQKGIESARAFFEALDSPSAQKVLDHLELKLHKQ